MSPVAGCVGVAAFTQPVCESCVGNLPAAARALHEAMQRAAEMDDVHLAVGVLAERGDLQAR